jgi:hypothetical protein
MTESSKAIGVRVPIEVWEMVREYGLERYPSPKSKEGIDVTQTIVTLLKGALSSPDDRQADIGSASEIEAMKSQIESLRTEVEIIKKPLLATS